MTPPRSRHATAPPAGSPEGPDDALGGSRAGQGRNATSQGVGGDLLLSIGGVVGHLALGAAPGPFIEQLRQRYGPYCIPAAPWVEITLSMRVTFIAAAPIVDRGTRAAEVAATPLVVEESDRAIRARRWDLTVEVVPEPSRGGRAGGTWTGESTCQMNPFALDSLLRVLWSVLLPRAGGALLHACALRLGDVAVIFPGPSGAGKSTLARKMREPERVLTDELVAVSRGELGEWRAWGTPFWGEFERGGGCIRSWPVGAVSFLEQADAPAVDPIPAAEATFRLLGCLLCFQSDVATAARNLAIAVNLCRDTPTLVARTTRETPVSEIERRLVGRHLTNSRWSDQPPPAREVVSELRWLLQRYGRYAFVPRGDSMRPWLHSGDALFVEHVQPGEAAAGDILVYWTPGRTPQDDRLICHRMVARIGAGTSVAGEPTFKFYMKGDARSAIHGFENGRGSEVLGRVSAINRDGRPVPVPGRIGNLARLLGSLVATPILKMTGR